MFKEHTESASKSTTLTFQGCMTSLVTWPFDTPSVISYRCSIVSEIVLYLQPFSR